MEVQPRILVVEDDASLRLALETALVAQGYDVVACSDHAGALAVDHRPHLAVLDVGLPGDVDGFEVARRLRSTTDVPVLFVTAADRLEDRLNGFEIGADDYIVKPFAMAELLVRIRAVLRRTGCLPTAVHQLGDLVIDEQERVARRGGVALDLTRTEFELLTAMARHPGQVFSKARLLAQVWGFSGYDPNLVEVHVSALRRKTEAHGPRVVHTERGVGYRLAVVPPAPPSPSEAQRSAGSVRTNEPST